MYSLVMLCRGIKINNDSSVFVVSLFYQWPNKKKKFRLESLKTARFPLRRSKITVPPYRFFPRRSNIFRPLEPIPDDPVAIFVLP
jgi:hypothetical protein